MTGSIKAKTIKFNLIMEKDDATGDYASVRSIEGLQKYFNIEDVLKYFENSLLERWLEVRGFTEELEKIRQINRNLDRITIARELVKIFNADFDEEDLEEAVSSLRYEEEERESDKLHDKNVFDMGEMIKKYIAGYDKLIETICSHSNDWGALTADVEELQEKYSTFAERLHDKLFYRLKDNAPMAILVMLSNNAESIFRKLWLSENEHDNSSIVEFETLSSIKGHIRAMLQPSVLQNILGNKLIEVCKNTHDKWSDVIETDVAVLYITSPELQVRNWEQHGEAIDKDAVNGNVQLLKGLQLRCSTDTAKLYYVEV